MAERLRDFIDKMSILGHSCRDSESPAKLAQDRPVTFYSTHTGTAVKKETLLSGEYWALQLTSTVMFSKTVEAMILGTVGGGTDDKDFREGVDVIIEIGPQAVLSRFGQDISASTEFQSKLKSLPSPTTGNNTVPRLSGMRPHWVSPLQRNEDAVLSFDRALQSYRQLGNKSQIDLEPATHDGVVFPSIYDQGYKVG